MTPDLKYLLFSVILTFVQMLVAASLSNFVVGLPTLAGNREGIGEMPGAAGRAKRAHLNMIENMVLFAALVLIAAAAGKANAMTAMGASAAMSRQRCQRWKFARLSAPMIQTNFTPGQRRVR